MKFSELQDQLQEKFGIDRLADIARELGVSPQAVSNWKARDRVPYKYVLKIRQQLEESDIQVSNKSKNNTFDSNQVSHQHGYPQYSDEKTISITETLLLLSRQIKIIIITPTIICLLTIYHVLFIAQPVYVSTAKIMSSSGGIGGSQAAGIAAQLGFNLPTGQSEPEWVYPEIIKSRTIARAMLNHKFDTDQYGSQKPLLQILTYGDEEPTVGIDTLIKFGIDVVIGMIDIKKSGSFYDLTISGPEPLFVRDFASALIEELDRHQRQYNQAKTSQTRQFIEERIFETRKDLEIAEEALKYFTERNRRIENSPALQLERQRLARETSVLTGVFTTLKQQLETTKIEEVKDSDYVIVLDPPEAPLHRSNPDKKKSVILAGFLGIGLGIGLAFMNEVIRNTINDDPEIFITIKSQIVHGLFSFIPFKRKN